MWLSMPTGLSMVGAGGHGCKTASPMHERTHFQRRRVTTVKFLVDANVLSEPTRPGSDAKVVEWLRRHEREVSVDPIILGECDSESTFFPRVGVVRDSSVGLTMALGASLASTGPLRQACGGPGSLLPSGLLERRCPSRTA